MARVLKHQLFTPVRVRVRRSWPYRLLLSGSLPDRIVFHLYDAMPRRLEDADALLRGRFRLAGETVEVRDGSIFDKTPPSREWLEALHGFQWLVPLAAAGGDPARTLACNLIGQWQKRHGRYSEPAWQPEIMSRRLFNLFCHGRLILSNSDVMWRSKFFVSLRDQSRMLARIADEAPEGIGRLEAASVVVLAGACLDHNERAIPVGLKFLEAESARQLLTDGGHISRNPEALLNAFRAITVATDALLAIGREIPDELRRVQHRIAPMLRFFRHGDGALALFNGGHEGDVRAIAGLLARDDVREQPVGHASASAFHRLAGGATIVVLDSGQPPPLSFAADAHAGCLSFELSTGGQRIVVNCGSGGPGRTKWRDVLAATAAHSTLTIADTSSGSILADGLARRVLGPRLVGDPMTIHSQRSEDDMGTTVQVSHDGYLARFGILHERRLTLSPKGQKLSGVDRLLPPHNQRAKSRTVPFAARFHIHPDIRISRSNGGDVILKLPHGEGWRFCIQGGSVVIEESVYVGSDTVRRSEQLLVGGEIRSSPVEIIWSFERMAPDDADLR